MIQKIKDNLMAIGAVIVALVTAVLFAQRKKIESTEAKLADAVVKNTTLENDHDRAIAKEHADELLADYDRKRREYDENKLGGGS